MCIRTLSYKKIKTNKIFVQHHLQYSVTTNSLFKIPIRLHMAFNAKCYDMIIIKSRQTVAAEMCSSTPGGQGSHKSSHGQFTVSQQRNGKRSFSDLIGSMQEPAPSEQFVSETHSPSQGLCRITSKQPADGNCSTNAGK